MKKYYCPVCGYESDEPIDTCPICKAKMKERESADLPWAAEHVLGSQRSGFIHFLELAAGNFAYGAGEIGGHFLAFIDVTADGAYEFFHVFLLLFVMSHEAITVNFFNSLIIITTALLVTPLKADRRREYNKF